MSFSSHHFIPRSAQQHQNTNNDTTRWRHARLCRPHLWRQTLEVPYPLRVSAIHARCTRFTRPLPYFKLLQSMAWSWGKFNKKTDAAQCHEGLWFWTKEYVKVAWDPLTESFTTNTHNARLRSSLNQHCTRKNTAKARNFIHNQYSLPHSCLAVLLHDFISIGPIVYFHYERNICVKAIQKACASTIR